MISASAQLGKAAAPPIAILGVPFDNVTTAEAVALIEEMIASRRPHYLVTANVDFLVQAQEDVELRRIFLDAHLVLCDGTPLLWASRLLGNPLPERVAGADIVPLLIRLAAQKGYRLFFLGATPESCEQAVAKLAAAYPEVIIAGHYSPPFNKLLEMDHEEIKRRIRAARPDLLFVSFGCPKQEKWIAMHYHALGVPVAAGVGATIDFLAGYFKRAPAWMQRSGTEWIFRLAQEPRRLFRRYVKDLWVFGWSILAQWWQLQFRDRHASRSDRPGAIVETERATPVSGDPLAVAALDRATRSRHRERSLPQDEPSPNHLRNHPFPFRWAMGGNEGVRPTAASWHFVKLPERLDLAAVCSGAVPGDEILANGRHCLLDMADVKFIDSTGIGLLIRVQKRIRDAGHELVLVAPTRAAQKTFALMGLTDFFAFTPDVRAAERLIEKRAREHCAAVTLEAAAPVTTLAWHGEITAANVEELWQFTRPYLEWNAEPEPTPFGGDAPGRERVREDNRSSSEPLVIDPVSSWSPGSSSPRSEEVRGGMSCVAPLGGHSVIIDLSAVRFIDSSGLGLMVRLKKLAQRQDTGIVFGNLQPPVRNVLRLARLEEFLLG